MDLFGNPTFSDQTLCDINTILKSVSTVTPASASSSRIETIISALLDGFSDSASSSKFGLLSSLKTLHLLLQVCVCEEEHHNGFKTEFAVKSLKISYTFLQKNVKVFDTTADTLCNIIHLSLLLMSPKDLVNYAEEVLFKSEKALSIYLSSENQQVDSFAPQVAIQLLTVVFNALHMCITVHNVGPDDLSAINDLKISHDLVVQLTLCNNDTLRAQTLIILIPKILKKEKNNVILKKLLDAIVLCQSEESLGRGLSALSALCTYYLPEIDSKLTCGVEENDNFWLLIQRGLYSTTALTRKHALYLIRRCVGNLVNEKKEINCDMFYWTPHQNEKLFMWWQDICTVLEVLEERAFHLISPVLSTLQNIFAFCAREDSAPTCFLLWCFTVFKRLLQHSCVYVVKWGVDTLIGDVGCDIISSNRAKTFYPFFVETLIYSINTPQIFYDVEDSSEHDHEIPELEILEKYFVSASRSETRQEFFTQLFNVMGSLNWAPISLYIITKSLSKVISFNCLNPKDTLMMKRLVTKILATQNVSIRVVSLQYVFITVVNLMDCESLDLKTVLDVLTAFHSDENLCQNTELWDYIVEWIHKNFNENQVASWMIKNAHSSHYSPSIFAQLITLLYDAGKLKSFESLENLLSLLSDCNTRLYVDQDAQTKCVEIVAHMARASQSLKACNDQSFDNTREAVLFVIKSTAANMIKLLKMRLFCVENLPAYHIATKLLKCFELICKDQDVALIFSKENSFSSFICAAFDIVENDFEEKKINYIFAMNVVTLWCKTAQDSSINCQLVERITRILKKILHLNTLMQAPFAQTFKLPSWTPEISSHVSSAVFEAQWNFVALNISESVTESTAVQIVEAVGEGLDTGGRNILPILLKVLGVILAKYPKSDSPAIVLRDCWSNILEARHKDIFYAALREFLSAVFQPDVFQTKWGADFVSECGQELLSFCEYAYGVVGELAFAVQNLIHRSPEVILQGPVRNLVVSCFVLSFILRRDQKLTRRITSLINFSEKPKNALQILRDDPSTFVRCTAIEILYFLISDDEKRNTEIGDLLTEDFLQQTETQEAKRTRYFSNSLTHRIQLHVLQGLMLVEPKTSLGVKETLGKWLLKRLLNENHQLSVRYLTEWLLVRICCSVTNLRNDLLELVEDGVIRESALCSMISSLLHLSHYLQFKSSELNLDELQIFLSRFFKALLPLSMSQAYSVRFNAHVAILQVWEIMEKLQFTKKVQQYEMSALAVQKSFCRASNKFQNHKDFYLMEFQCAEHYSLETLFYDMPRLTQMTRDECIKPDLLSEIGIGETGQIPLRNRNRRLEKFNLAVVNRPRETDNPTQSSCIQKKMVPSKWLEVNELQVKALPEVLRPWKKNSDLPNSGLVVVASLLDKASNLGGLSRTCEIMGASLVLPKLSVASDREFQALSMSSEMWAPLSEVKAHDLTKFLAEMKRAGFTLVGAEQTARSTSLADVEFPENTVLLLGNECEGIPSNLLPLLDVCVEIPQYGLVRSLNVHVAGALFIYEYRRQHQVVTSFNSIGC